MSIESRQELAKAIAAGVKVVGNPLQPHYLYDPKTQTSVLVNPEGDQPVQTVQALPMPVDEIMSVADTLVQQVLSMVPATKNSFMQELKARNRTVHALVVTKLREIEGLAGPAAPAPDPTPPVPPTEPLNAAKFTADLAAAGVQVPAPAPAPEIVWTKELVIEYAVSDTTTDEQYKALMSQLQVDNPALYAEVAEALNTPEPAKEQVATAADATPAAKPESKSASRSRKGNKENTEGTK